MSLHSAGQPPPAALRRPTRCSHRTVQLPITVLVHGNVQNRRTVPCMAISNGKITRRECENVSISQCNNNKPLLTVARPNQRARTNQRGAQLHCLLLRESLACLCCADVQANVERQLPLKHLDLRAHHIALGLCLQQGGQSSQL